MTLLIVALPETDAVHPLRSDDTPQP